MKVITIKQPFASLIAEGLKEYEFRTWKTKYRGEILIHAGKSIDKKAMKKFEKYNLDCPTGCIIAKANLTDCIQIDDEARKMLEKKKSLVYSSVIKHTEWNGYGFKLENVKKIEPIIINGKLSLWDFTMDDKEDTVDLNLQNYIKQNIFPKYNKYYSHGMIHINNVINNMMFLADYYKLDKNMAYVIASYHDIGLNVNRENHEYESGKILSKDKELKKYFNDEQIQIMKEAVEDHRGSKKERPRNFYGECVSDSDRDFDISILAKRQLATSLKNYPDIDTFNEHFKRCHDYICKRINSSGVFNLWTNNPVLIQRRDKFQKDYLNVEYTKSIYKKEWDRISADGTKEKIINYYEDY